MKSFEKSLLAFGLMTSFTISCQHFPPANNDETALKSDAGGKANSKFNSEDLIEDTMEYDGRDLNVRFFVERGKDPKQGIFWIDGEVFKLKLDKLAVAKKEESVEDEENPAKPQHLQQFAKKFGADKELRIIINTETGKIQQPWYGDWAPNEKGSEGKVDGIDAATGKKITVLFSKKMNDFVIAHIEDNTFLLRFAQAIDGSGSKTFVFESEHTDTAGKKIQPLIKLRVENLPVQNTASGTVASGPAIALKLTDFPKTDFRSSAIKVFDSNP